LKQTHSLKLYYQHQPYLSQKSVAANLVCLMWVGTPLVFRSTSRFVVILFPFWLLRQGGG
jgi:hypothetical protein